MIRFIFIIPFLLILQSCAPIVGVVGVASIASVAKKKGIGTSLSDALIHTRISNLIFKYNNNIIGKTNVYVDNGSVLITGKVKKSIDKIELTKISWSVRDVKKVNNEIQITDVSNFKNIARDLASMGEIRARMISDKRINSLNFSVDVVNDKAYISGIAETKEEMSYVKTHASSSRFIREVFNYISIYNDPR